MKPRIVITISATSEWNAVPEVYPDAEYLEHPYGQYIETEFNGEPVILMQGGWSKIQSAASTQYAIDRWSPELIVNLGTCGGFRGEINRDEIVMVEKALVYDIISQIGNQESHFEFFTTEIDNSWIKKPYPIPVTKGTIVSGDRDIQSDDIPMLIDKWSALVGDWESGGIAFVCRRNNVKLLILRGVSDLVGLDGGDAYDGTIVIWSKAANRIIKYLLASIPNWLSNL